MRFSAQNRLSLFSPNTRASDLRAYRRADYYCSRAYLNAVAAAAAAKEVFHIRVISPPQQALGGCGTWLFFNSFACARQHCLLYIAIIIIRLCTTVEHTVLCRNLQLLTGGRVKDLTFPGTYIDFFFLISPMDLKTFVYPHTCLYPLFLISMPGVLWRRVSVPTCQIRLSLTIVTFKSFNF